MITLGECLLVAERRFEEAEAGGVPGARDHVALAVQARRMVTVLGLYLDIVVPVGGTAGHTPETRQAAEIRSGLRAAGSCLDQAMARAGFPLRAVEVPADPVAARYARAVDALVAGAELVHTHVPVGIDGRPELRSDWAQLLAAGPVVTALAEEVTRWGARAGRMVERIIRAPGQGQRLSRPDLAAVRDRLAVVARADVRAGPAGLDASARQHLLFAIPAVTVPERVAPAVPESDEQLCAGISISAQRLRAAAFAMGREQGDSPALSGPAWRKEAHASAVICDLAARTLQSLADQPPAQIPAIRLADAASCLVTAREAWRHTAWMWQAMATDTTSPVSRTAAEASDLAVRLGRLLTGEPGWMPSGRHKTVPRAARSLAPGDSALATVLGAVHEAADAVTRTARADMAVLPAVQRAGRLYMRADTVGEMSARYDYIPAPGDRIHLLKNAYYLCTDATWQAARRLDALALDTGAPSRTLALVRAALPAAGRVTGPETGFETDPAAFSDQLELFTRLKGQRGRPRSQLDPDAVIRAYEDENLSLKECAQRFATSGSQITAILTEHGHQTRSRAEAQQARRKTSEPRPDPHPDPRPGPDERSPLYHQLRELGIDDPGLLLRAATIDTATADVLRNASQQLQTSSPAGIRRRSPAQIAALDGTPATNSDAKRAAPSAGQGVRPSEEQRLAKAVRVSDPRRDRGRRA